MKILEVMADCFMKISSHCALSSDWSSLNLKGKYTSPVKLWFSWLKSQLALKIQVDADLFLPCFDMCIDTSSENLSLTDDDVIMFRQS